MRTFLFIASIIFLPSLCFAQCTAAKEPDMQKYLEKTQNQDAQGCSQCGMLALYFCSARYCVKPEDIEKVGQLINACKQNILNMGQPYCCPEYINKDPEWGKNAGGQNGQSSNGSLSANATANSNNVSQQDATASVLNALSNLDLGSSELNNYVQNYAQGQQIANSLNVLSGSANSTATTTASQNSTAQVVNALSNLNLDSGELNNYAQNYAQGQQIGEVANGIIDLFTPSAEEKARKEAERVAAAKRAEEYRQAQLKLVYKNEQNAKTDFSRYLKKYPPTSIDNKSKLVIDVMDNYISDTYSVNAESIIPEWSTWIKEAIKQNDKFTTVVFAGKTLGFNVKRFPYNIGLSKEEAVTLLEKISDSNSEYKPFAGISYDVIKKTITEKNKKKKIISKGINTFKVIFVAKHSCAEASDIKIDDIILKINNSYSDDFASSIEKFKIEEKIAVTILRDGKETSKEIILGSIVKNNYNVDAMLILANNYNLKNSGNNPEKALYYFTKAAENGSPNAMFALGEIYQNNVFGDKKVNVKFKFKKNPEFALEWYLKSIQDTNYKPSIINALYKTGSTFEPQSFDELIQMYKKGIGCKKSPEKADEILALKNDYLKINAVNNSTVNSVLLINNSSLIQK